MRAASRVPGSSAHPAAWRRRLLAVVMAVAVPAAAGCGSLAEAQQVIGRADLVNELSARLSAAEGLTYSADYQLPEGRSASIARAQKPPRAAYVYPEGELIVTEEATTECQGTGRAVTCQITLPPSPSANPSGQLFAHPGQYGMIPPTVAVTLLTAAALDPDAVINQHDTTVAGEHATCVDVQAVENADASAFNACITTTGVLGSFSGTVNGKRVELTLTRYRDTVDAGAFDPPAGAKLDDRRPR
jgi:hypothetical protein